MANDRVYIIDGARSPFLRARNAPGPFPAAELAVQAGRQLLLRQAFPPEAIDEVIVGCAAPAPEETNIGRLVALRLGCGDHVPGWTVQRNCASGMQALHSAARSLQTGASQLVLAGGVDALSRTPVQFSDAAVRWLAQLRSARSLPARLKVLSGFRPGMLRPEPALLKGLTDPVAGLSMGQTAEVLATRFDIGREAMDAYALRSHQRASQALSEGAFDEIVPIIDSNGKVYSHDDGIRTDTGMAALAGLKPVFDRPFGRITAGNSSQVTDGAALLLLASGAAVERWQLQPLGELVDTEWAGLDPSVMGLGPVHASTQLLRRLGLSLSDVELWELNEAFAAQVLACLAALNSAEWCKQHLGFIPRGRLTADDLNIHGGAIAIGHPVGATGARLVLHLLHALRRSGKTLGMATLCIGGGQGGAMLVRAEAP